ncbi:MAG TPA: glutaminyl-peptide cyclotransferase [Thermoanaerobaculia bacterium]|jgi:glutamine cyclotransferase|nr:glutaminyl-peptide cyclotransferase [Thermoanaerobaculia bacterium]
MTGLAGSWVASFLGALPLLLLGVTCAPSPPSLPVSNPPPAVATPAPVAAGEVPPAASVPARPIEHLGVHVLETRPHDATSYTQGLVWHDGKLYESAGQYGRSDLREADPETGTVRRRVALPPNVFGEGLALVGNRLIQLSWREGVAFSWDLASFTKGAEFRYAGEGWGLCYDGKRLIRSDGTDVLTFHDPVTFAETGRLPVRRAGQPVFYLNELECVGKEVYANVYQTDEIVRIDAATGEVTASIDASGLITQEERQAGAEVLNGIAWNPDKKLFYITGKLWSEMFEVRFEKR